MQWLTHDRAVKFAFLALYFRLMTGIKRYMQLWWVVIIFSAVVSISCSLVQDMN